jgi:hypothetical protein
MLFEQRLGFSGTPSDLLPVELGRCHYEKGSDGKMLHLLTSPKVLSHELLPSDWSVFGLLDRVAQAQPPFHALLDTGALITGMSNVAVAMYLLEHGLESMDGVVYLDEHDRKMVVLRQGHRVMQLAQCGIPKHRRFSFYDQIHTTGMDIKQALGACAALTLGKDMVFRDYAQGAFRMRGIGAGQTVHLLVIPEVVKLIETELIKASAQTSMPQEFAAVQAMTAEWTSQESGVSDGSSLLELDMVTSHTGSHARATGMGTGMKTGMGHPQVMMRKLTNFEHGYHIYRKFTSIYNLSLADFSMPTCMNTSLVLLFTS